MIGRTWFAKCMYADMGRLGGKISCSPPLRVSSGPRAPIPAKGHQARQVVDAVMCPRFRARFFARPWTRRLGHRHCRSANLPWGHDQSVTSHARVEGPRKAQLWVSIRPASATRRAWGSALAPNTHQELPQPSSPLGGAAGSPHTALWSTALVSGRGAGRTSRRQRLTRGGNGKRGPE